VGHHLVLLMRDAISGTRAVLLSGNLVPITRSCNPFNVLKQMNLSKFLVLTRLEIITKLAPIEQNACRLSHFGNPAMYKVNRPIETECTATRASQLEKLTFN
jgi:hypothetical protein